ncbi:MAG: terminase [Citromicrobium sp.]|nr:terminase [Citromicrobium sp.]
MSLVSRHRNRVLGKQSAAPMVAAPRASNDNPGKAANDNPAPGAPEHSQLLVQLGEDLKALSQIQSIEQKIARKAKILPGYDAWVEGVLQAATDAEAEGKLIGTDAVLVQTMIWAIDAADFDRAFPRAKVALRHGMDLPQRFERTLGCMIAEEFAETALKAMNTDNAHVPDLRPLLQIADLTEGEDMPDQARAKIHKAIGMTICRMIDAADAGDKELPAGGKRLALESALNAFRRALALHDKCGVKKMIEQRERDLKALPAPNTEPANENSGPSADDDGQAAS